MTRTKGRLGLFLIGLVGATASYVGCGTLRATGNLPDNGAPDAASDSATGAKRATDGSGNAADTTGDALDEEARIDAEPPPFDCDGDVPDAGPDAGPGAPYHLACTGLYADFNAKTVDPSTKQYTPGLVLWSDGAIKTRWVHLPAGQTIDVTDPDEWQFPVGTKFFKEFVVGGKRVETRMWWKVNMPHEWVHATYQWSADGTTTATRLDTGFGGPPPDAGGATGVIDDGTTDGGLDGARYYEIPSVQMCTFCHDGRGDKILSFEAVSLGVAGASGVTLKSLKADGLLATADGGATTLPDSLTIPEDGTGHAAEALGWLHANCGTTCHNAQNVARGVCPSPMHLRLGVNELAPPDGGSAAVQRLEAYTTTVGVPALLGSLGDPEAGPYDRIKPGVPSQSLVRYLAGRRVVPPAPTFGQMCPYDSHVVDVADIEKLNAWILAGPGALDGGIGDAGPRDAGADSTGLDAGSTDGRATAEATVHDGGSLDGGGTLDAAETASGEAGCSGSTLIVKNYLNWCSVSVAGGAFSADDPQTVCVAPGVVSLAAMALPAFELGPAPWHDTSGDTGSGDPGTVVGSVDSTTVTVASGGGCVWVCCPFTDGTGCPVTDQCP